MGAWSGRPTHGPGQQLTRAGGALAQRPRSVSSIKNYWQRQIFSGKESPPPEVGSDAAVISFIKSHPGGIGYVSSKAPLDSVKVLSLTE